MDPRIAAARFAMGQLRSDEAIAAANAALDAGVFSESLAGLISEEPIWSSVGPLFKRAMAELHLPIPSRAQALAIIVRDIAKRMIEGELAPYEGARRIWTEVTNVPEADRL